MARRHLVRTFVPALLVALAAASEASAQPRGSASAGGAVSGASAGGAVSGAEVSGAVRLAFLKRPAADGSGRVIGGGGEAPVLIRFVSPPTKDDLRDLTALGVRIERRRDGSPRGLRRVVAATLPEAALAAVAALPRVTKIALDGAPFAPPRPLDATAAEIQAPDTWRSPLLPAGPLTGKGITVCDIDSGIDPFHPLFFRADGGYVAWVDADGDGKLTPGVDGLDLGESGVLTPLRVLDSLVTDYFDDEPLFSSDDPGFALGEDFLYADADGSGKREFGAEAGFKETDPTYGERLFVADDVNKNGVLDRGEKLVALGSSKIRAVRQNKKKYYRGVDLVETPPNPDAAHGTGAAGVMAGGALGLTKLVGIAPDAEIVSASNTDQTEPVKLADFCIDEGARVVLHEYAPWVGYHLDGSSDMEALIDETVSQGVAHVNPAGNLSTSQKLFKKMIPAGAEAVIPIEAPPDSPYGAFKLMALSVLWRDTARALTIEIEDPTGLKKTALGADPKEVVYTSWSPGITFYAFREDSPRGTARADIYVFGEGESPPPIPLGTWKLRVTDPSPAGSPDTELIAYVLDEASGWGKGIYFPEDSSEDHLIGFPGTADHGIAVAAYTGHGWHGGEPGQRAEYSGRGRRIDGAPILWISAPDDPITSGYREGSPGVDFIYGGTSGASPHVAGAAALLLQADPNRTGVDVREAIKAGALVDDAVGQAPNEDFGNGKLRIYRSLFGADPPGGSAPSIKIDPAFVALGKTSAAPIEVSDPDEPASALRLEVDRDYDGVYEEVLEGRELPVKGDAVGVFTSKVRVMDATGRSAAALAVIDVKEIALETPIVREPLVAAGGSGCASHGRDGSLGAGSFAGGALLAFAVRLFGRRRRRSSS
jgi:subtilisin family serine protease